MLNYDDANRSFGEIMSSIIFFSVVKSKFTNNIKLVKRNEKDERSPSICVHTIFVTKCKLD